MKSVGHSHVFGCFVWAWWSSFESTSSDLFRSRSGNIQEQRPTKPETLWLSYPKRPLSRSGFSYHHSGNINGSELEVTHHMVTGVREEIPYCSSGTSSGKEKKARSTSQPQFGSGNTPPTIEADHILLDLQQVATNCISVNFNSNISRISKLPKSLTTTMPTFDGKSEKFELFEDLFQTSLKIRNQLTEEDKTNYFHSLMRSDALQVFKNITSPNRETLGEFLTVFRRKFMKPQSMATAEHKFQRLFFNPAN